VDDTAPPPPPSWMRTVRPGTLDRRILEQDEFWVTEEAQVLRVATMSSDHLVAVAKMLEQQAMLLHLHAMVDLLEGDGELRLEAELTTFRLTGRCLTTTTPEEWLAATTLMRALRRELARRDVR